ncbi:MAG: TonB-dependent receptor [Caulobacterales bacterium]
MGGAASADQTTAQADPTPGNTVSDVVVAAPREEVKAREVQQSAINLVQVQSAETILKYPDFNAAESLGRIPGVSLSSDTAEGRFVNIRGIDANLNGATYGGVPLLNTFPGGTAAGGGGRAVEFDTVPTGAIDGIVVTFTGLPDHEAEGLGGSVELSPRVAANVTRPFADITLGTGYEPLHDHTGPNEAEVALGGRFGGGGHGAGMLSDGPFSFVLTASVKEDRRAIDDLEESYIDDGIAPNNAIHQYDLRRYNYHRTRFGYGGELDYQPNDNHAYYLRVDLAGYTEEVHKNFLLFRNLDGIEDPNAANPIPIDPNNPNGFLVTTQPRISLTDERETHRNEVYVLGGRDNFGGIVLDYRASYSRASFLVDRNIGASFNGPTDVPITYDNKSSAIYPAFTFASGPGFPNGFNVDDATQYTLKSSGLSNSQDRDYDEEFAFAANASIPVHWLGDEDQVKIGGEARLRDKVAKHFTQHFTFSPINLSTVSNPAIRYYNNHYSNGPQSIFNPIRALVDGGATSAGLTFSPGSFFDAREDIYAGYAQYAGERGKWGYLVGVRVEATDAVYGALVPTPTSHAASYVDAFPTLQVRYSFTPQMVLRATYSTGIGRAGFTQNTAAASVDLTQLTVSRGNPKLKPTFGNNFDLVFEDYLPNGGIIQLGVFDKEFTDYIAPRVLHNAADPLFPVGETGTVTTFLNIPRAYARGVEGAYHQAFTWLPRPFDGFGIEANVTLVDSRILEYDAATSATGRNEFGLLPGTSQVTWNLAGFYEAHGLQLRLASQYVSHSLFGLGGDKALDTIQDDRLTMDFTSSYRINPTWTVYFSAKNLLNTPLRYYEGVPNRPVQREFYDATFEGGIRAHF